MNILRRDDGITIEIVSATSGEDRKSISQLVPITVGIPFPKGLCADSQTLALFDAGGRPLPLQAKVLDVWADGSIRWALIDFQLEQSQQQPRAVELMIDGDVTPLPPNGLAISEDEHLIAIDTGAACFRVRRQGRFPFQEVTLRGKAAIDPERTTLEIESAHGSQEAVQITEALVEEAGPLRAVIALRGLASHRRGKPLLDVTTRLHFYAGLSCVRFDVTIQNPRKAAHPGGYWDLGAAGSVYIRDLSFILTLPAGSGTSRIHCSPERDEPFESADGLLELYQDSSGGENWRSANHLNRHRQIPMQFRGYRLRTGSQERAGARATPIVSLSRGAGRLTVAVPQFWQNFPKAVESTADSLTLRLFPRQYSDLHEIQGGEQKTHTFFADFGQSEELTMPLGWARARIIARAKPSWYCSTGALPYLTPAADDPYSGHQQLVNSAIEGPDTFEHKREAIDEYGWRNFGDIYADHEAAHGSSSAPLVSHYNNQYDAVAGFACQFLRTGDPRWWQQMNELAHHVIDIDLYHTDRDKSAFNRGLFWHTYHYVDADTATHRSYPLASKASGAGGGGPSAEHNYTSGLMLHYFLTGDCRSRDAAIDLARFVVDIDDGRKTVFRWLSRGRTGLATASGSFLYHGPGRAGGNSLNALIDGHRLTGKAAFLEKAEEIIRRAVHPGDDVEALELLDAERRWFYTVFLQALGKYLDHKIELGTLDSMYAYGHASLLHYARWMAANEYPYLDKPEILEYPTETWAAQDMRKSEVFLFAGKHSTGEERNLFCERARFFFDYAVRTLGGMKTRTLARPVVLMLRYGLMEAHFRRNPDISAPLPFNPVNEFGAREQFVPQKALARRRLVRLSALLGPAAAAAAWLS